MKTKTAMTVAALAMIGMSAEPGSRERPRFYKSAGKNASPEKKKKRKSQKAARKRNRK